MLRLEELETDILIIGGGAAGCYSAITLAENSDAKVVLVDKANIKRSGCLAAGVNALNAYITPGETPESYVEYVNKEFEQVIRRDLVYSIGRRLNKVTQKIEQLGLPILKDEQGNYVARGRHSIKINGENIKPILAEAVNSYPKVTVLNHVNICDYLLEKGQVIGAWGFSLDQETLYVICAKAVICATGINPCSQATAAFDIGFVNEDNLGIR
ncbi:MAG TPA: FAD-binding protein, partial [Desulfobacteria bacterium]|nr:FAD-binding protein [Desulfobacteria bacterium]